MSANDLFHIKSKSVTTTLSVESLRFSQIYFLAICLFYENNGKRAHASLANIEKILPVITLDGLSQDEITQEPQWEELNIFTRDILDELKKQIHYTPQKL